MKPNFWNEKYAEESFVYGTKPNRFLELMLESRPPGRLLFPCDGEGRNAVYAAKLGWEVYAFDQSSRAQEKALALAKQEGVSINYALADALEYDPSIKFDAVALIYAHFPEAIRQEIHQKMVGLLKPVGELWLEAFAPGQLEYQSGGPKDPSMLYTPEILEEDFQALQIRQAEVTKYVLDEGPGHRGMGEVVRLRGVNQST